MTRVPQPQGTRGSLKWIQQAVNDGWPSLNQPILDQLEGAHHIDWRSPLQTDDYAEYRDGAFLDVLGLSSLKPSLKEFWPAGGPQWDALGVTSAGTILLVEAKAHIAEMCSPGSAASPKSLERIRHRLDETATRLDASRDRGDWHRFFYQISNRLAHLDWMRNQGIDARLVLVNFLNDLEMKGPATSAEWKAAYQVAMHVLGLGKRHPLSPFVIDVFPDVSHASTRSLPLA